MLAAFAVGLALRASVRLLAGFTVLAAFAVGLALRASVRLLAGFTVLAAFAVGLALRASVRLLAGFTVLAAFAVGLALRASVALRRHLALCANGVNYLFKFSREHPAKFIVSVKLGTGYSQRRNSCA